MPKRMPEEDEKLIIERYLAGINCPQIAKETGYYHRTILNVLRRNNIPRRPNGKILDSVEDEIVCLYDDGNACHAIAERTGLNVATVFNVLKRKGVTLRTKGGIEELPTEELVKVYQSGISITTLAVQFNVTDRTICNYLEAAGVPRDNIYHNLGLRRDYFAQIDTYDKAYFLGLIFTDGNVGKNNNNLAITLNDQDSEILETFREKICNENPLKFTLRTDKEKPTREVEFHCKSADIKADLSKYGIVPQKTYTAKPPVFQEPMQHHFIRGLIDGDGWISEKAHQLGFCGNEYAVTYVHDLFVDQLGVYNTKILHTGKHLWQVTWASRKDIKKIGEYMYEDKGDCYLKRKYEKYQGIIQVLMQ